MKKYFPILLSKAGEIEALIHLTDEVKNGIAPIIEVLKDEEGKLDALFDDWNFDENAIYLDFSYYGNTSFDIINSIFSSASLSGANAIPVVQQNSSHIYFEFIQQSLQRGEINEVCIRISRMALSLDEIINQIIGIQRYLNIENKHTSLLIDLGYAEGHNVDYLKRISLALINAIPNKNEFRNIILASGSFPMDLSSLQPSSAPQFLRRLEKDIWDEIQSIEKNGYSIIYSDYGIKNPLYKKAPYPGTCSIKYTLSETYLIYRGQLAHNHRLSMGQFIVSSRNLVNSGQFWGRDRSWSENRIIFYAGNNENAEKKVTGNLTTWAAIGQNHHISFIYSIL